MFTEKINQNKTFKSEWAKSASAYLAFRTLVWRCTRESYFH